MWRAKLSYSLPGQDVLVAQFLGEENLLNLWIHYLGILPNPVMDSSVYISKDASYAEVSICWESQLSFDQWYSDIGTDYEIVLAELNAHGAEQGIIFKQEFSEVQDSHSDIRSDLIQVEGILEYIVDSRI